MVIVSQSALSHCCETIVMSTIINPYRKNKGGKCQANLQVKQVQKELETKKRKEPVWWYQNPKVKQAQKENTTTKPYSNSKPNGNDKKEDGDKCQPLWTWKPQQEEANREPPFRYNPVVLKKYTPDAVMTQFFNAVLVCAGGLVAWVPPFVSLAPDSYTTAPGHVPWCHNLSVNTIFCLPPTDPHGWKP